MTHQPLSCSKHVYHCIRDAVARIQPTQLMHGFYYAFTNRRLCVAYILRAWARPVMMMPLPRYTVISGCCQLQLPAVRLIDGHGITFWILFTEELVENCIYIAGLFLMLDVLSVLQVCEPARKKRGTPHQVRQLLTGLAWRTTAAAITSALLALCCFQHRQQAFASGIASTLPCAMLLAACVQCLVQISCIPDMHAPARSEVRVV